MNSPRESPATRRLSLPPLSLRNKLSLFAAVLILGPGLLFAAIAERGATRALERATLRELTREAEHTADRLAATLRAERETLEGFARQDLMRDVRVGDIDKRVSAALATLRDADAKRLGYWVIDESGRVIAATDPARVGALDPESTPGLPAPGTRLSGPLPRNGGEPARIVIATPVPDPDARGRVLGTLIGSLDWERVTAVTRSVRDELAAHGAEADVLVSRPSGEIVGGAHAERRAPALTDADSSAPYASDASYTASTRWIVGRSGLGADFPELQLLIAEPREIALAPTRQLRRWLLLAMGLALAGALGLAAFAARRVVRPLSELTRATQALAAGDAGARSVPVRSDDEIGTLAASFNRMAADLERAQRELVEAEQFAFVGELAAGVAHQIRTSLGVLRSSTQILERSLPAEAGAQVSELALMIREEIGRLGGVVNDLLTLERGRPLRLEAVHVSQPLVRAAEFVATDARTRGVSIERALHAAIEPEVSCEPELIYQVAVNLIVNAMQALTAGGRIELRVLPAQRGFAGFEVRDDGPGIPEQLRARIFQPFVTGRPGGIGLGMTFVKRVVHDHHGRIAVESAPGTGTCIRVELPLAEDAR